MQVKKRDGSLQKFDEEKIRAAVQKAWLAVGNKALDYLDPVIHDILNELQILCLETYDIEQIQDIVEKVIMKHNPTAAKAYILYREEHAKLRELDPDPNAIADFIHASKYAKWKSSDQRRETYQETITRNMNMHQKKFPKLAEKIGKVYKYIYDKKVLPSMRSLQFGGEAIEAHNTKMYNCTFTLIDRVRVFQEIFYLLLSGCGVGFSVQKQHVSRLPKIKQPNSHKIIIHHVEDSIIGWANAIGLLFQAYQNEMEIEFCFDRIRPEGSMLKTGGGRAPGHIPLKRVLNKIKCILDSAISRHLKPIECHDIICFIAEAVLAGGVRRSSLISLFSKDDDEMLSAKLPENFDYHGKNSQRAIANNSVMLLRKDTTKVEFLDIMRLNKKSFGEPGFVFTDNLNHGTNPCGEIGLDPTFGLYTGFAFCNLCEVNVAACKTKEEFYAACQAASFIGTLQASYTSFPYLGSITEKIAKRDALLGVGLVGIMDNPKIGLHGLTLERGAKIVVQENQRVSKLIGINPAKRCTTVKPSGTSSLALGCIGSGIHPHHARRYFRRITANPNEPVAQFFIKNNSHMAEIKPNNDICITFPVKVSKEAIIMQDLDPIEFMNNIFLVYKNWILTGTVEKENKLRHNISSTITVPEDRWEEILNHVWNNRDYIRAMSFFPEAGDKKIPFAPREKVLEQDEAKWRYLIKHYKAIDYFKMREDKDGTTWSLEPTCDGDSCKSM
jgi:ribonucleoside-diphosphate reductase alpha chain